MLLGISVTKDTLRYESLVGWSLVYSLIFLQGVNVTRIVIEKGREMKQSWQRRQIKKQNQWKIDFARNLRIEAQSREYERKYLQGGKSVVESNQAE